MSTTKRETSKLCITGPLCGGSTGHWLIPLTKGQLFAKIMYMHSSTCISKSYTITYCFIECNTRIQNACNRKYIYIYKTPLTQTGWSICGYSWPCHHAWKVRENEWEVTYIYIYTCVLAEKSLIQHPRGLLGRAKLSGNTNYWDKKRHMIDPSHKFHSTSDKYPPMHHFVTEMCTCAHFCYKMVHCGI